MTKRIFRSIALVALAVFLAAMTLIHGVLYSYFSRVQRQQLRTEVLLTAQGIAIGGADYLENLESQGFRITWVAGDGSVLFERLYEFQVSEAFHSTQPKRGIGYGCSPTTRAGNLYVPL